MRVNLASYNIQYGVGKDDRLDLERIAGELGDADIIALQEVDVGNPRRGLIDQPAELARLLGHPHWFYSPGVDVHLGESVPGGYPGLRRKFGNMVLSRWPLLSVVSHALPKVAVRETSHMQRTLIETVIDVPGAPLRFYCTHFDHASPMTRMPQARMLLDTVLDAPRRGAPWAGLAGNAAGFGDPAIPWPSGCVVMGDLNCAYDGPEYEHLIGDISPMLGKRMTRVDGLLDAWVLTGHAEDEGLTFVRPDRPQERVDHCFVTGDIASSVVSMRIDDSAVGSDHQPIFVTLDL